MGKDANERPTKLDAGERIDRELAASVSYFWGAVRACSRSGTYALYFRQKIGGIWTAVAKRSEPDSPNAWVAFGSGHTIGSALAALSVSMQQGKWKRDLPWDGRREV